jgi:hypothetical protein
VAKPKQKFVCMGWCHIHHHHIYGFLTTLTSQCIDHDNRYSSTGQSHIQILCLHLTAMTSQDQPWHSVIILSICGYIILISFIIKMLY